MTLSRMVVATIVALALGMTVGGRSGNAHAADPPPAVKAGFAERDITPEKGLEQPGGYGKGFHTLKHDNCLVRAAVFDDGKTRAAVVGIDALGLRREQVEEARAVIEKGCGIPPTHVLIAASHTHAGGPTVMVLPGEYDHASELVKKLAYEKSSMANKEYLARVVKAIGEAVIEADGKRAEARVGAGFGLAENVAFNRRFHMRSGGTMTHPGQGNPDIVEPAGPVDPQVGVLGVWNKEGKLIGCVVNFACHATTSPGGTSADYIHYIQETIRGAYGQSVVTVFVPGCAGDVTQVDNRSPYQIKQFGEDSARKVGGTVAAEAIKTLVQMHPADQVPVAVATKTITFKRRVPRPERVAKCLELVQREPAQGDPTDWTFAKEVVMLDALLQKHPTVDVEVQALQIGPAVFCTSPAEYFCQFGLDIKAGSKFPFTFPVSLANGCVGYVPTEEALGPKGGGYETRLTAYSNLEVTAGRQIADTAIALAKQLTPAAVNKPPQLPAFTGKPWTYGSVPPERE